MGSSFFVTAFDVSNRGPYNRKTLQVSVVSFEWSMATILADTQSSADKA